METLFNILIGFAVFVAAAYIVAGITIFICAIIGGIADENELKNK